MKIGFLNRVRKNKIQFKQNIKAYLAELKELTEVDVSPQFLSSLEEMEEIRKKSSHLKDIDKIKYIANFSIKNSDRFKKFIANLSKANNSPVYIWTKRANSCGLYKAASINAINFSFEFDLNTEGIVTFTIKNANNQLLLDFYRVLKEQETIEIEVKDWYSVSF